MRSIYKTNVATGGENNEDDDDDDNSSYPATLMYRLL